MTLPPDAVPPALSPALSEKEWREQIAHNVGFSRSSGHGQIAAHVYVTLAAVTDGGVEAVGDTEAVEIHWRNSGEVVQLWNRHKLASLCLYNTSEGFTPADVEQLRDASEWLEYLAASWCPRCHGSGFKMPARPICTSCGWRPRFNETHLRDDLRSLANRIAALLPPHSAQEKT